MLIFQKQIWKEDQMYKIPQQIVQLQAYTHELVLSARFCDIYPLLVNPFDDSVVQIHLSC